MLLAIDIGNTNITCGVFRDGALAATWRLATRAERTSDEYGLEFVQQCRHHGIDPSGVEAVAVASVVPPLEAAIARMGRDYFQREPLFAGAESQQVLRIEYAPPADLGADRVVNAVAGFIKFGGPLVIADFGTATTLDAIRADGVFAGGAILPGIRLVTETLAHRTARLPRVDFARAPRPIGRSTVEGLQSGMYYGGLFMVEGLVRLFREELGPGTQVVATGGLAGAYGDDLPWVNAREPNLTLEGLYYLYRSHADG